MALNITVVRGRFTADTDGALAVVRCNVCAKIRRVEGEEAWHTRDPGPGPRDVALTGALKDLEQSQSHRNVKGRNGLGLRQSLTAELTREDPNPGRVMLVAPAIINGRPMGLQAVVCFYCGSTGLINFESTRRSPGVIPMALNGDPQAHAIERIRKSFYVLLVIDHFARTGVVHAGSHVVCPGASVQIVGRKTEGYEDAHQILREVTLNGAYLYDLAGKSTLSPPAVAALRYCVSVISHLPAKWNRADCLVEHAITVDFIELVQSIVSGRLRATSRYRDVYQRYLWRLLVIRYYYACRVGRIYSDVPENTEVLGQYIEWVGAAKLEGPPNYSVLSVEDMAATFKGEIRE